MEQASRLLVEVPQTMIGNERITIERCSLRNLQYGAIWSAIRREPDFERWFGAARTPKVSSREPNGATAILFVLILGTLMISIVADSSPWNSTNIWICLVLGFLGIIGVTSNLVSIGRNEWRHYAFLIKMGDVVIGVGDIYHDVPNVCCSLTAAVLPEFRGRKLGSVGTRLIIRYCFEKLGANRVESTALSTNPASVHMNDRMIEEGVAQERVRVGLEFVHEHGYRLLRSEWEAQIRQREADKSA